MAENEDPASNNDNTTTTNTTTTNNNGRHQLEEIRQLHAARFRHARATPLPPRHHHQHQHPMRATGQEPTGASRDNRTMNDARERQNREEGEEQRQEQRARTSIPNLIPGALNFGIAMAHARHALGRHMQQQQQQQRHQRDGEGDAGAEGEEENVDEDMEEEEDDDENAEEEEEDVPDEDVLPKPSYLTDDHLLAAECAKTGKAPEQLEREYKDEVFARKWQMKEARMEERRQSRRAERRREREQQQQQQQQHHQQQGSRVRRRDEVNERPGDSVRRRQTRIEIQVGGPNGPVFRSFMGGPGMVGMIGREGVGPEGQQQQNGIAEGDPFLEIMREVLGQRAPGEAREDVLNDNDRFERAFRNMFQSIEQQSGAMGGGQPPGFMHPGSIRGFGDLLRAMHGFAAEHANGDENLAEAPLTQQQIDAMETIVAKGDENNGSRASCSVCLSDIESGENMKKLPCGHCYHSPCIDTWLLRSRICPTCRHDSTKPPTAAASTEAQRRSDMD